MTKDKTVTMSRELAETLVFLHETDQYMDIDIARLREVLAAPVVERQEPVAWRYQSYAGGLWYLSSSEHNARTFQCNGLGGGVEPLYTSPLAPVAVVLPDLGVIREYHLDATIRLDRYAADADMRKSDSEHYRKRAAFHRDQVATIDKSKELNQ